MMKKYLTLLLLSVAFVFGFSEASPAAASTHYTVQAGDSLWKIARQFKVSFVEILNANRNLKNPSLIYPHQVINLPQGKAGMNTAQHSDADTIEQGNDSARTGTVSALETQVLNLVNQERQKVGLNALTMSDKLVSLAEMKAQDMAQKNYFSHTSPTYGTPFEMLQRYGVSYRSAGENIAAGQTTAEAVMQDWMNSSGHRANILNSSYTEIGVGYYSGGSYRTEWVQLFIGK